MPLLRRVLVFALCTLAWALEAAHSPGPAMQCAMELNAIASTALDQNVTLRWLGGNLRAETPFGWLRLAFPVFDPMLLRTGLSQDRIDRMKGWLTSLRLSAEDARELLPEDPALMTSFVAATFFRLNQLDRELHAAIVPYEVSDRFPHRANAYHVFGQDNFYFAPEAEVAALAFDPKKSLTLARPKEAILLRRPRRDAGDDELMEWVADLLAAISRWQDLDWIARYFRDARPHRRDVFRGLVGVDEEGHVALASPYFPLFLESRAEALRAWVLHRLRGDDWEAAWFEGQAHALATVGAYTPEEALAPYEALPEGLYWSHAVPLDQALRLFR